MQTLHDGTRHVHEPLRLNAILEAPVEAISAILDEHQPVRELVENGWIHLYALLEEGRVIQRYRPGRGWTDVDTAERRQLGDDNGRWMERRA